MRVTDLELVRAAADGDTAAFHTLVDRHARGLFRLAMSLSPTRSDAEDICQETLVGAFRGLKRFAGRASVKTWLMRILMRRAAKHWHKHRHVRKTLSLHVGGDDSRTSERQEGLPTTPSASVSVDQRIDLHAVIRTLVPEHRQVILLRETQGLSYEEIAQTLQIPRGTVESRLHRARLELRERMKDYLP